MQATCMLTVAAGKRLIAHGTAALPSFQRALQSGLVAIVKGTTNAYLAELVTGQPIEKLGYARGRVIPRGAKWGDAPDLPDTVLRDGRPVDLSLESALAEMKAGDIYVKGGNALQPDRRIAGVLIGSPTAGTLGLYQTIGAPKGVELVIPIGLEKVIAGSIAEAAAVMAGGQPRLEPVHGTIVTEIEALELTCGVTARQVAAGGVLGAEGSIWLRLEGSDDAVQKAQALIAQVQDQPPFPA